MKLIEHFIDGKNFSGDSKKIGKVFNPATGGQSAEVKLGTAKDLNKAAWTANQLQSGQVYVNKWFTGSHATPFGGYKQSGYSREKGVEALKAYLQVKNVGISLG